MGVRRQVRVRRRAIEPLTASGIVAINLRKARELRGLSQAEAGDLLGRYLRKPWSAATVSAAERSWERGPERSFTANELDGFAQAFRLPVLWFLLPSGRLDTSDRPLPSGWVKRLLWTESRELQDRVELLAQERRGAVVPEVLETAADALAGALKGRGAERVKALARQLRDIAESLERISRHRKR